MSRKFKIILYDYDVVEIEASDIADCENQFIERIYNGQYPKYPKTENPPKIILIVDMKVWTELLAKYTDEQVFSDTIRHLINP